MGVRTAGGTQRGELGNGFGSQNVSEQRRDRKRFVLTGPIKYRNTKH